MIRALIIEDEPASREVLQKYVEDCPGLELAGSCENALQAIDFLNVHEVDLLLLDIQMPGLNGIDFFKSLNRPPAVIFTTAYAEYAVEGFELDATDYLLKPFPFERFLKAIAKVRDRLNQKEEAEEPFLMIKSDKVLHKVFIQEIIAVEACGDYLKLMRQQKNLIIHDTMSSFLSKLPEKDFIRVHKSYIINMKHLKLLEGNQITLTASIQIPIGKAYRKEFLIKIQ